MDEDGVKKRKAAASATLRKKPRRDKSEFVSVEVGMREFKKRLAASDSAPTTANNTVEDLTQDEKVTRARAKPKTIKKATPVKKTTAEKKVVKKMPPTRRTTRASSKMTLAEVKAQLEREQQERVEYRIQTLQRAAKPASSSSPTAPATINTVTSATVSDMADPVAAVTSTAAIVPIAPANVTPAASPVHQEAAVVTGEVQQQNLGEQPVALPNPVQPIGTESHVLISQGNASTAPQISVSADPASSTAPPSSPVKNEFIVDDMDEDLMFAMALEEVEWKLATPQKSPPSSEAAAATTDSNPLATVNCQAPFASSTPAISAPVEPQMQMHGTQILNATQPQPTETMLGVNPAEIKGAVAETKQAEPAVVMAPGVLEEMERLRRENELLRRSNELLQAAVTSPAHAEAPAEEQLSRSHDDFTAQDEKNDSTTASPKDISSDAAVARPTARYLDLARCDSDQDMEQTAFGNDQPENDIYRRSAVLQSAHSESQGESTLEDASAPTKEDKILDEGQRKPKSEKYPIVGQEILTEHVSELSSAVTSQEPAPSTPLSDHSIPRGKDDHFPTQSVVSKLGRDNENEVASPEKAQPMELSSSNKNTDGHSLHMTGSDGDVSDASMPEADEEEVEEETMQEDGPAPRASTIDSGNYAEYKFHQGDDFDADEDEPMEESCDSMAVVSEEKVGPAPTVSKMMVINEPGTTQRPGTPANSGILKRTTPPSNTDDEEEAAGDEVQVANRAKRREVIAISSSSESETESEQDDAAESPRSNVLEAALRAAGGDSGRKNRTKSSSASAGAVTKGVSAGSPPKPKSASSVATTTTSPSVPVKSVSMKRKTPGFSSANAKKPPSVKSSLLWPALDEFYDFLLDISPRNVHGSEKKRAHLQKFAGGKLPAQHSSIEDYCDVQLEAIMEELVASVSNTTGRRGGGGSGPTRHLSLASVSPCGTQGISTPSVGLSLGAIFSESGFSGNTSNNDDFILTFDASALGKKASSDFLSGDLVLLRSPRWKNYEMCVFGVVLCDSVVAVGGKGGPGGKRGGSGESDQICVLIRAQQRDRDDTVENFSVLTELCMSNQRAPNWRWSMQQVHNTTTSAREFQAIKTISFLPNDLKDVLVGGQLVPATRTEKKSEASSSILSPRLLKYLHKHYNDSQVQAILGCLGEDSRVIIQGPPGTGKTKTILGLLSALLDGAGLSTLQKAKGTARIRVGASLQSARTSAVSKTVAETSIRILVAAPSNAAVDELVVRVLSEGLFDGEKGESYRPRIVRVGRPESSQQLSSLAAAREASESKKNRKKMRKYAREVEEVLLESLVTKHRSTFPTVKQARQAIIKSAQIVFCTLSGAGSVAMCEFAQDFDALIIDEAAQAVEASMLIPFKFRPHRVVLVGDHRQLPATVISKKLVTMGYDRSLQQRLVENGSPVLLLNQQYRMHPEIAEFPSTHFYGGRLVQDDNMREWTAQDYHRDRAFKPLLFLDVQGAQSQVNGSTSLRNMSEVEAVIQLIRRLLTKFPRIEWKKRIGVIAPYKQQIYEVRGAIGKLEAEFDRRLGIEVNTVDGFQGREKEIIIYSCVRTSHGGRRKKKKRRDGNNDEDDVLDAFWADERRMNVAITRAKSSLWIVGNSTLLKQSRAWRALIQHTKDHKRYISDGASTLFATGSSTRKASKAVNKPSK